MDDINDFTISLGHGAYGKVFGHIDDSIQIVLKKIPKGRVNKISESSNITVDDILSALENIKQIKSNFLCKIYNIFDTPDYIFVKMEPLSDQIFYLENYTLKYKYFNDDERTKQQFIDIIKGISDLHKADYVHNDLTPTNILEDTDNNAKIIDFDTATNVNDPIFYHKMTSAAASPPEMILDDFPTDANSKKARDIWGLAIILYIMINNSMPFKSLDIRIFLEFDKFEYKRNDAISDELNDLLTKMFSKNPKERIQVDEILEHPCCVLLENPWIIS